MRVQGVDNYDQPVEGESFVTRRAAVLGAELGRELPRGRRTDGRGRGDGRARDGGADQRERGGGGRVGLDRVFEEMSDGRGSCVVRMKTANGVNCVGKRAWREA